MNEPRIVKKKDAVILNSANADNSTPLTKEIMEGRRIAEEARALRPATEELNAERERIKTGILSLDATWSPFLEAYVVPVRDVLRIVEGGKP